MSHRQLDKSNEQNCVATTKQHNKSTALRSTEDANQQTRSSKDEYRKIPNMNMYFAICVLLVTYSIMGTTFLLFKNNPLSVCSCDAGKQNTVTARQTNNTTKNATSTQQCNLDGFQGSIGMGSDHDSTATYNYKHYSFIVFVWRNKLGIRLTDNKTKYIYKGLFNATELEMCGFVGQQTKNMQNIFKFLESAINGHEKIKFNILLHTSPDADISKLNIIKQDDHFPQNISLPLIQIPRKQTDILKELVVDLQNENVALVQKINTHGMPKGTIVMWSGNATDIPHGWIICDGQNNTPDLRNRFVIGASGEYTTNSKGGTKTHTHQIKDNTGFGSGKYKGSSNIRQAHHTHQMTVSHGSHLPPYYALCFIKKNV